MVAQGPRGAQWRDEYSAYLLTPEWKSKRARVLKRASGICEGCGINRATEVHHLNYKHIFKEFLFDLVAVCDDCHERIHEKKASKVTPRFDPTEWDDGFPCESCRHQDEESNIRWCGKFHVYARVALADDGDCGPRRREREPLK